MMLLRTPQGSVWAMLTATANTISWQAATLTLAALAVPGVLRLCTEWQRRRTFLALVADAPEGTVVVQQEDPGGQTMKVTLGRASARRTAPGA
ncbi:hypothetical protein ACRYCC_27430 [Actinomadura scrupuli]|uniref:hypothetical protein n=1 Tax=Actinomadura scrupuli TaxID=559629 RepID=UPI003D99F225